jgi:hypothetical protein
VLRRCLSGGILRLGFGERPSIQCHGWARSARYVVPRDLSGFGDLRRVRSNTSLERTRSTSSAKLIHRRARRSAQSLGVSFSMPIAPLRFEVSVNGVRVAVIGANDPGVLTAIVGWVKRSASAITNEMRENPKFDEAKFLRASCDLELGGLDSETNRHMSWARTQLTQGDEVTIKVLGSGEYESPLLPPNTSLERTRER